jgi:tetraacyldisaccharide 4'-kinase
MDANKLIQNHLLKRSPLSYTLYPAGVIYGFLQKLRRTYYQRNEYKPPCKIISIGNIVSGGSGKTPLTISLAKLLIKEGIKVAISHRGYKGAWENNPHIIADDSGLLYDVQQTGDEAYLIASSLPQIPVAVGRKRKEAIQLLLQNYPDLEIMILDDALQHYYVHRDLDIISFDASLGLGNGFVLPAGYLREPISNIPPNSIAVINHKNEEQTQIPWLEKIIRKGMPVFHCFSSPSCFKDAAGNTFPFSYIEGKRIVLTSAIANPASFEQSVCSLGLSFMKHYAFKDHYAFSNTSLPQKLLELNPDFILCTQKDIMKLAKYESLKSRLLALELEYSFEQQEQFVNLVLSYVR